MNEQQNRMARRSREVKKDLENVDVFLSAFG